MLSPWRTVYLVPSYDTIAFKFDSLPYITRVLTILLDDWNSSSRPLILTTRDNAVGLFIITNLLQLEL